MIVTNNGEIITDMVGSKNPIKKIRESCNLIILINFRDF